MKTRRGGNTHQAWPQLTAPAAPAPAPAPGPSPAPGPGPSPPPPPPPPAPCVLPPPILSVTRPGMASVLDVNLSLYRNDIAWNGAVFCAVATGGIPRASSVSADGTTWSYQTMPTSSEDWSSVAWNGAVFCAVCQGVNNTHAATSPDGITWTARALPTSANWVAVVAHDTLLIAVAAAGGAISAIATSANDGATWTARSVPANAIDASRACSNGAVVCVVGLSGDVLASADGITWTNHPGVIAVSSRYNLVWNGTLFCTVAAPLGPGTTMVVSTSPDGVTWTDQEMLDFCGGRIDPTFGYATGMAVTPEGFILAGGLQGRYSVSLDNATTWYTPTDAVLDAWPGYAGRMAYDGTKFVVIGQNQRCDHVLIGTPPPGTGVATVTWDAPAVAAGDAAITGYSVYYQTGTLDLLGAWTLAGSTDAATFTYGLTGLANGVLHWIQVRAVTADGEAPLEGFDEVTPP